jgi:CTP:molybdopterin cytidylyltransferase MocA
MPVDQPLITSAHLDYLLQSARQTNHCAFTRDGEIWGPPAAIPRAYFAVIRSLSGEEGLKAGIKSENRVFCDAARMLYDIDTQEDLDRLNQAMKRPVSD